jgi:hypothetical protein
MFITARPVRARLRIAALTAVAITIAGALALVFAPFTVAGGRLAVATTGILAAAPQTVIVECQQYRTGGYRETSCLLWNTTPRGAWRPPAGLWIYHHDNHYPVELTDPRPAPIRVRELVVIPPA